MQLLISDYYTTIKRAWDDGKVKGLEIKNSVAKPVIYRVKGTMVYTTTNNGEIRTSMKKLAQVDPLAYDLLSGKSIEEIYTTYGQNIQGMQIEDVRLK